MPVRLQTLAKLNMENLIEEGSMSSSQAAQLLQAIVKARMNVLVSGDTGSGKTTMLNILAGYIPEDERIITVEDSAELQMQQPHVVCLISRPASIEGYGEITLRDLFRNSLRMRPERIVIGEVRGAEAFDMLQAMNTGHRGLIATINASSPRHALSRFESMVMMSGTELPARTIREQIVSAVDVVVHIQHIDDRRHRVVSIREVNGMEGDRINMLAERGPASQL